MIPKKFRYPAFYALTSALLLLLTSSAALLAAPPLLFIYVDVKPQSCPNPLQTKSGGVVPVAVLGTEEFDVTQIDPATIRLQDAVAPLRWSYDDVATPYNGVGINSVDTCTTYGPDGLMDLTLKFKTQELIAALGEVYDGDVLPLILTGNLKEEYGGSPVEGVDIVLMLVKE